MHVGNARQATGTPAALGGCGINEKKMGKVRDVWRLGELLRWI